MRKPSYSERRPKIHAITDASHLSVMVNKVFRSRSSGDSVIPGPSRHQIWPASPKQSSNVSATIPTYPIEVPIARVGMGRVRRPKQTVSPTTKLDALDSTAPKFKSSNRGRATESILGGRFHIRGASSIVGRLLFARASVLGGVRRDAIAPLYAKKLLSETDNHLISLNVIGGL